MNLAPVVRQRFFDDEGQPLAYGKLYTYQAGSSTPLTTYLDKDGTPNENPVTLDAAGYADIWIGSRSYKFVLQDSDGNEIWTQDDISIPQVENGFSTGELNFGFFTTAKSGWVMFDDKSIGSLSSGATGRANDDTEALFLLLWSALANAQAPVSGGRGVSAEADWAADKTLTLPRGLGRAIALAGSGSGLTSRTLGEWLGTETHTLTEAQLPVITVTQQAHNHTQDAHFHTNKPGHDNTGVAGGTDHIVNNQIDNTQNTSTVTATNQATTAVNDPFGSGDAHPNMQPTLFLNAMIKL